jgi:hypothetical protein
MLVRLVVGFDPDGLQIPKWREAFQQRGAHEGELTIQEQDVPQLRRRALVARLQVSTEDQLPQLVDVVVRYAKERVIYLSGISEEEPWRRWRAQAWRIEVIEPARSALVEQNPHVSTDN